MDENTLALASILWDYHHMQHPLEQSDCILALGSHDLRVAERAAELYLEGYASLVVMSGGLGNLTAGVWEVPEADQFAKIAVDLGVPAEHILVENRSTNTGENMLYTQELFRREGRDPQSFIVVQKPYMERRSYATFKQHWPDKKLSVTSPQLTLEEYPNDEITMDRVIHLMVGDLQRIKIYPEKGFQIYQEIPEEVWSAFEELVHTGYTDHLIETP